MTRFGGQPEDVNVLTRYIVAGADRLAVAIAADLADAGFDVVQILPAAAPAVPGATVEVGAPRDPAVLERAGVRRAAALVLAGNDDLGNLHAALVAREAAPGLRLVVRIFNPALAERCRELLGDCIALSSSAMTAPALIDAALGESLERTFDAQGRRLRLRWGAPGPGALVLREGRQGTLFPVSPREGYVLEDSGPSIRRARRAQRLDRIDLRTVRTAVTSTLNGIGGSPQPFMLLALWVLLLVGLGSAVFSAGMGLSVLDALYFTVTTLTTTGYGDLNLLAAPPPVKLFGVGLMLVGALSLAVFFAVLTEALVRSAVQRGVIGSRRLRGHVIVLGLGTVGYRIVERLVEAGVPVASADVRAETPFQRAVERVGVPVVVSDVRYPETLDQLGLERARAIIAATGDDETNLAAALSARSHRRNIPVVLRLLDPDLAARLGSALGGHRAVSVITTAVPAFSAAALGADVLGTIPVGDRTLLLASLRVSAGSGLEGDSVSSFEEGSDLRVVQGTGPDGVTRPVSPATAFEPGTRYLVVATKDALLQAVRRAADVIS